MNASTRVEHDLLGDRAIPGSAYYGVHTLRALENFDSTHTPISIYPDVGNALGCINHAQAREFSAVLKMGRTQLQDAVPMTLGQEFSTYAVMLGEDEQRLREACLLIHEINLGATAIGTGINAHPRYASVVCRYLSEITG